ARVARGGQDRARPARGHPPRLFGSPGDSRAAPEAACARQRSGRRGPQSLCREHPQGGERSRSAALPGAGGSVRRGGRRARGRRAAETVARAPFVKASSTVEESPVQSFQHRTVLRREAVDLLAPAPGKVFLDGTLGGGGHAEALLDAGAKVIGLDQDPAALEAARTRLAGRGEKFVAEHANFRDARGVLDRLGVPEVDGALVDLGVSSPQLDQPERGFSFRARGPLDMRMDPTRGQPLSALLAQWDERALARIVDTLGEERFARPIARAIHRAHRKGELEDTAQLAELVARSIPRKAWPRDVHPATRTFQALRIAVNDELGALSTFVGDLPRIVGRRG